MTSSRKNEPPAATNFEFYDANPTKGDRFDSLYIKSLISAPLKSMADQTYYLRAQIKSISSQLVLLESLTKKLLAENGQLRKHLQNKTHDISKVITTIQTNLNEEVQQYQHMIHLYRESNSILLKKNEQAQQYKQKISHKPDELRAAIRDLNQQTLRKQNQHYNPLKVKIQNNYNKSKLRQLQDAERTLSNQEKKLLQQIQDLNFDILSLKKNNITVVKGVKENNYENKQNAAQFKQNIVHLLKTQQQLKDQIQSYKQTSKRQKTQNENLSKIKQKKYTEIKQTIKKTDKKQLIIYELQSKLNHLESLFNQYQKNNDNLSVELYNLNSLKEKLTAQLVYIKKSIDNKSKKFESERQNIVKNSHKQLSKIIAQQRQLEDITKKQVRKMAQSKQANNQLIRSLKEEFKYLSEDQKFYNETLESLSDPTDEIKRFQIMQQYQKRPLSERN